MPINCRNDNKFKWSERLDRTRRRNKTATSLHIERRSQTQDSIKFLVFIYKVKSGLTLCRMTTRGINT
ncbi:unnamed protein product [Rhizophagus irregularis]|uniref:Uncharacterized protein n=1 Tax=Rhizophagus irregularis TaxID=588596 RepID=A0A915ZCD9_9GLOM|nr:unnamed protein product [Rhizophagus irregularis]